MGKRPTMVCTHCNKEKCDGIIYKIAESSIGENVGNLWWEEWKKWRGCKNDKWIDFKDEIPYFHWVMGHGNEDYLRLKKVEEINGK